MPKQIDVVIEIKDYPYERLTPSQWESWIVGTLKAAGVPIRGVLLYDGLTEGTLVRLDDPEHFGRCVYRWRVEDEPNEAEGAP